jgi:hypothetical protein
MGKRREVLVPGHLLHVPQPGRFHVRSQCPVHWPLHFHLRYCDFAVWCTFNPGPAWAGHCHKRARQGRSGRHLCRHRDRRAV